MSAAATARLAPPTTTIMFSPAAETQMWAWPVGASARRAIAEMSTPAPARWSSRTSAASSCPRPDESRPRAPAGAGDRLVRPLAAGEPLDAQSHHRLSGRRQLGDRADDVEVDRAQDADAHRRTLDQYRCGLKRPYVSARKSADPLPPKGADSRKASPSLHLPLRGKYGRRPGRGLTDLLIQVELPAPWIAR